MMRLLNVNSGKLETFFDGDIPEYAILSHRWTTDEVELPQLGNILTKRASKFQKIRNCCQKAAQDSLTHVWIDTCCIDKTNSQELSEAINSMYKWYEQASICYVYLEDVTGTDDMSRSQWFTRGWTLQELIAPKNVHFFNHTWSLIGSKTQMLKLLSRCTGIPEKALRSFDSQLYPVAQKLSWASKRRTTRVEDRAYSLLGICGINMPLNYGEGEEAFLTLQRRIIESYDDQSIFAWSGRANTKFPFLAASPDGFEMSHSLVFSHQFQTATKSIRERGMHIDYETQHEKTRLLDDGFQVSNAGLSISLFLVPLFPDVYLAMLRGCSVLTSGMNAQWHNANLCLHLPSHNNDQDATDVVSETDTGIKLTPCPHCLLANDPKTAFLNLGIFLMFSSQDRSYKRIVLGRHSWVVYQDKRLLHMGRLQKVIVGRQNMTTVALTDQRYRVNMSSSLPFWLYGNLSYVFWDGQGDYEEHNPCPDPVRQTSLIYRRYPKSSSRSVFDMPFGEVGVAMMISFTSDNLPPILLHVGFDETFAAFCLVSKIGVENCELDDDHTNIFQSYVISKYCDDDCQSARSEDILHLVRCLRSRQDTGSRIKTYKMDDCKLFLHERYKDSQKFYFASAEWAFTTTTYGIQFSIAWNVSDKEYGTMYRPDELQGKSQLPRTKWFVSS